MQNKPLYLYRDTQFNLSKRQVIDLLMGTKLYGDQKVALRELLQNSIDACLLRQAQEKEWKNPYNPEINVKYYESNDQVILEVEDNGTGMDQYIIDNYYSKIGSSFYKSTDFYNLKSESNAIFTPTSRFGIGILSCFMVADVLEVDTKRVLGPHKSSDALNITVEGQESIFWIKDGIRDKPGTTTKLILRKTENPWDKLNEEQFISSVEDIVSNPPFKINITTNSGTKTKDENSFRNITAESLKNHTWDEHKNIKLFNITLDNEKIGIVGSVIVAVLVKNGNPTKEIHINSTEVEVNGEYYTLDKNISISANSISESSNSLTVNDDGDVEEDNSTRDLAKSRSQLSLHGIEVPTSFFPYSWEAKNTPVKISWPFPLLFVIDICGERDLELNSSRTQILLSDKWLDFEEKLAFLVCSEIANSVDIEFWKELNEIWLESTENEVFIKALKEVLI